MSQSITIPLSKGYAAIIDAVDYPLISPYAWHAGCMSAHHVYAMAYVGRYLTPPAERVGRGGKHIYLHRLLMDPPKGLVVDHINGDTLDNRRENLRVTTPAKNAANRHRVTAYLEEDDYKILAALSTTLDITDAGVIRAALRELAKKKGIAP